ncbi:gustatory and pheromone receptor 32a-like [Anopheles marshallii]|uniref:gustatory and pheromone receptor 32a-like n=1 Tax=Anopheles marshallii TaxID=1521116 RepID=UPI00237AD54D|nr:gustatory and pheromone receptor 32a-like [Anopheles marshallii]
MRAEIIIIFLHNLFGGPISNDDRRSKAPRMFMYTTVVFGVSVALFTLCMLDLPKILYQRDLVLSVIDLLMMLGIAATVFTIQTSTLVKCLHKPKVSIFRCLEDIDGHLYTLNMRRDPGQSFSSNCAISFIGAIIISFGYLLANVLRIDRSNGLVLGFKVYGLFVIFLMHGLFLVFSYQILKRIRYMVRHMEKMIATITRHNAQTTSVTEYVSMRCCRDLRSLATVQMLCFRAVNRLNEECGLPNVTIFGMFFYVLTAKSFQLFYVCSIEFKQHGFQFTHTLEPTVLLTATFLYFSAATYLGELVLRETQLVINNLHKFESMLSIIQQKLNQSELVEQFGNQIMHQPICFTVMNFFQIDLKFFHLVMASVGTYLIILLQFDFQN